MTQAVSPIETSAATARRESHCSVSGKPLPLISVAMRVARSLWPTKTEQALAHVTQRSERMCRYWLAERYGLSADDLAALLRSEHGFQFLEQLMGDARPAWWAAFRNQVEISELRRRQEDVRARLEALERGAVD